MYILKRSSKQRFRKSRIRLVHHSFTSEEFVIGFLFDLDDKSISALSAQEVAEVVHPGIILAGCSEE